MPRSARASPATSRPTACREPGERLEDELLIKPDKNPNRRRRHARSTRRCPTTPRDAFPARCDLVLVWGEGCDFDALPPGAKVDLPRRLAASRTTTAPTSSCRSACRPSAAATTPTSPASSAASTPASPSRPASIDAETAVRRAGASQRTAGAGGSRHDARTSSSTLVFIVYAMGMLITFGTLLTWVERKQAAVMSDRIGANRAYIRIPFTQVKLVWWGLFHGIADGLKMLLKENFQPRTYDRGRLCGRALGRVHAGAAGLRGDPLRRHARPGPARSRRSPTGSAAAPTRCRSPGSTPGCSSCSRSAA